MTYKKLIDRIIYSGLDELSIGKDRLKLFVDDKDSIPLNDIGGQSLLILGITGSGKSNTTSVLLEEFIRNRVCFFLVDMQSEYLSLKKYKEGGKYVQILTAKELSSKEKAIYYAQKSISEKIPYIFDVFGIRTNELHQILYYIFKFFEEYQRKLFNKRLQRPYYIIMEEAHDLIPQRKPITHSGDFSAKLREQTMSIAKKGRKYGLNLGVISQRLADLNKGIISQCSINILHRVKLRNDLDVYKDILKESMGEREVYIKIPRLQDGECYLSTKYGLDKRFVRLRDTEHLGSTPEFQDDRKFGGEE